MEECKPHATPFFGPSDFPCESNSYNGFWNQSGVLIPNKQPKCLATQKQRQKTYIYIIHTPFSQTFPFRHSCGDFFFEVKQIARFFFSAYGHPASQGQILAIGVRCRRSAVGPFFLPMGEVLGMIGRQTFRSQTPVIRRLGKTNIDIFLAPWKCSRSLAPKKKFI